MMRMIVTGLALLALAGCNAAGDNNSGTAAAPVAGAKPPAGTDWTTTVVATPDGGYLMGNPNAPIKLVEYGSLSCSHCAEFSEKGAGPLKANYVATGKVSYEFRSYLLGGQDVPATLLATCGGPGPFFTLIEQMYADQRTWLGKLMAMTPAEQQAMQTLPPAQVFAATARATGLDEFVTARGIGSDQAAKCLADLPAAERLVAVRNRANDEYKIPGTPTFLINGQVVPETASWEALEPKLKAAGA